MKGVTHFMTGLCAASFFPEAVAAAVDGNPLYFMLGGGIALLPDTIDFKLYRYFYPVDIIMTPDPAAPDAMGIARRLTRAIQQVAERKFPLSVRLETIRLPGDCWLPYRITFDAADQALTVVLEAPCDSGGNPLEGSPMGIAESAVVPLPARIRPTYDPSFRVDIMEGPTLRFSPCHDGRVEAEFIPWHRAWSHSIPVVGLLAGVAALIGGLTAGLIAFLAGLSHSLLDQLGHMGSALKWPFSRTRIRGLRCGHSTDPWQNLTVTWMCIVLIGMNLARLDPLVPPLFNPLRILIWGGLIPLLIIRRLFRPAGQRDCQ